MSYKKIKINKMKKIRLYFKEKKDYKLIKKSKYFDKNYYFNQLSKNEKSKKNLDLIEHYIKEGWKKGYNPSSKFNTNKYLEINKDIKKSKINPLLHYERYGRKENRKFEKVSEQDYEFIKQSKYFDKNYYFIQLSETEKTIKNLDLIEHYMNEGWKKGYNPSSKFNTNKYLEINKDIKELGINPLEHYLKYGKKEKRRINASKNKVGIYKKGIKLLVKNPALLKKLLVSIKIRGIKQTIKNIENNLSYENKENDELLNLEKEMSFLDENNNFKIEKFYEGKKLEKPIYIVIPVYNGYKFLENLFKSIIENTTLPYKIIVGNDKSPDERVLPFLKNIMEKNPEVDIKLIDNEENLGFLKTVNKLLKFVESHVVILNTDTEVPKYWLERLMYPIFRNENKIASTTPFTNSGTICSFPKYLEDNEIYDNLELKKIDEVFKNVDVEKTMIEVPTGVGFCMGMNYNVLKKIGGFDEVYGMGYCEENDWCQRAIKKGYKNLHITNLFIYHKHGASFLSEDKKRDIQEHYKILLNKFPNYDLDIQKTIRENKLYKLREILEILIHFKNNESNILMIDHNLGGGATFYRKQKINEFLKDNKSIILLTYNRNEKKYKMEFLFNNDRKEFFVNEYSFIIKFLKNLQIEKIFFNSIVSYENIFEILDDFLKLKKEKNCLMEFPVHDFFCISPDYNLLGESGRYEGVPLDFEKYEEILKKSKREFKLFCPITDIKLWRENWNKFLQNCENILCFSHSSEEIVEKVYPNIKSHFIYIPHDISGTFKNIYKKETGKKEKVIGILGNINLAKGRQVIHDLVHYIEKNNYSVKIVLIGNIDVDLKSEKFVKTGSYKKEDIPKLVKEYKIDEFLIPSVWPETFSYTTDEIMQLGYPLTVFDIGAPAERVKNYEKGRVISLIGDYKKDILE